MPILKQIREAVRSRILGETIIPEEFATGIADPQQEISVMLEGMGEGIDVTFRHSSACAAPFLIAIAFEERTPTPQELRRLSLKFYERGADRKMLGEIALLFKESIPLMDAEVFLFAPRHVRNYCLPGLFLWAHYSLHLVRKWKSSATPGMEMSFLQRRAAMVTFIRPHPTVLGSIKDEFGGNMFPMNVMGALGEGRFGFALRNDRLAGEAVKRVGHLAISNVPVQHASLTYRMAMNHTRAFITWDDLPFSTIPSPMFQIPVPEFAMRVREMEVERVHRIGSHNFYVARILRDTVFSEEPSLCVIHGYYQVHRLRGNTARMKAALHEDHLNKHGAEPE